jgi:hypothetical protein
MSKALKRRKKSKISEKGKKSLNEQRIGKKWQKKLGRLCSYAIFELFPTIQV